MNIKLPLFTGLVSLAVLRLAAADFDVKAYGAKGDGTTLDTDAINQAIAAAASAGGGTVHFGPGTYATYSIHLKSNVALMLDMGSTVLAANPPPEGQAGGYDLPEPNPAEKYQDFGHTHWHNSLIWGENLENIAILGPGRIVGKGLSRGSFGLRKDPMPGETGPAPEKPAPARPRAAGQGGSGSDVTPDRPFGYPSPRDVLPDGIGNKAIALKNCRNVIFRDFTIFHGGHFAILATAVDNWTCDNLKIDTNRDGIDFDCCQNVRVANCTVNSPRDDGICPKSSFGLGYDRPAENITITNCQVSGFDEGSVLDNTRTKKVALNGGGTGRIKCGTESNGGFRNITISNCVFENCRGLALESVDGALMEDISISNITMRDIVNAPIFVRLGARLRGPDAKVGTARRIKIDNIVAHNVTAQSGILIAGLADHPIEDLALTNIFIDYVGGGTEAEGEREVPEYEKEYPEPSRFGTIPAWGLWARHVKNLSVSHVEFRAAKEDRRPTAILDDVVTADFDHVTFPHLAGTAAVRLKSVTGFTVRGSQGLSDATRPEKIASEKL
jgi:polygalacturonase